MLQSSCIPLYLFDTWLWVSILSEKIDGPSTLNAIPYSEPGKFYRSGLRWISDHTYITNDDMIVGGRLSKTCEMSFVERSVIVQQSNLMDLKTILINYLISRADAY